MIEIGGVIVVKVNPTLDNASIIPKMQMKEIFLIFIDQIIIILS
jgi:hypothetical protein